MKKRQMVSNVIKGSLIVLTSVFVIYGVAQAGTITLPSGTPVASFFTLSNIWTRLTTNGVATEGDHSFTFADSLAGTGKTLTEIYNAIPTINPSKLLDDTTYLGITGNIATQTLSSVNDTVGVGYYNATTLSAVDTDLAVGNILSGKTIFGVAGNVIQSLGDAVAGNVLAGKYFSNVTTANVLGTMIDKAATSYTPSNVVQTIVAGYYNGSGTVATDANLVTGNIKSGITIFGVAGDSNVVNTSSGDAVVGDILSGKIAWVDGLSVTGTMPTQTLSATNDTVSAGYYDATTLSAVDTDLTAGNILSGATIFGVAGSASAGYTYGDSSQAYVLGTATGAGTALKNLWNGTSGTFTGGSQANGGADDYNNGGAATSGRYAGTWTACNTGNSYCGTSDSGADAKDNSTGLVWSLPCNGSGCATFSDTTPVTYSWDSSAVNNNSRTASQLCSDHAGWSLPHQKQLMQAYIDGSYGGNLEASAVSRTYWSATTVSGSTTNAWYTYLSLGVTTNSA